MRVGDVMSRPVAFCHPQTNLAEAAAMMWDHNCGALPIVGDGGKLTGIVTDRDICIALGTRNQRASEVTVGDVSSSQARSCGLDDDIPAALRIMSEARVRRLPVVDSAGILQGILSLNDLVLWAQHLDGANRPGVSYEDIVNTLVAICRRRRTRSRAAGTA